jgi:hypothetical protein
LLESFTYPTWLISRLGSMATSHAAPGCRIRPADGPDWTECRSFYKTPPHFSKNQPTTRSFRARSRERVLRCAARRHRDPGRTAHSRGWSAAPCRAIHSLVATPPLACDSGRGVMGLNSMMGGRTPTCRRRTCRPLHRCRPSPTSLVVAAAPPAFPALTTCCSGKTRLLTQLWRSRVRAWDICVGHRC